MMPAKCANAVLQTHYSAVKKKSALDESLPFNGNLPRRAHSLARNSPRIHFQFVPSRAARCANVQS